MQVTIQLKENVYQFIERLATLHNTTIERFLEERLEDLIRNIPDSIENGEELKKIYSL